jgi:hypothetical protein
MANVRLAVPAERGVGLGAAVQLGPVHLGGGQGLLVRLGGGLRAAQEALPHGVLGQRLRAALLDQPLHDLLPKSPQLGDFDKLL